MRCAAAVEPAAPETSAVVLRVLGETLANVERHAGASRVVVELENGGRGLALTVRDDGCGPGAAAERGPGDGHFGIALMRERAASLGGHLTLGRGDGGGTVMRLEVLRA
jgi:two-component system sensor histidine kinase UhpB